jgi:hypothetical protein
LLIGHASHATSLYIVSESENAAYNQSQDLVQALLAKWQRAAAA